jgi:hypothetical protein
VPRSTVSVCFYHLLSNSFRFTYTLHHSQRSAICLLNYASSGFRFTYELYHSQQSAICLLNHASSGFRFTYELYHSQQLAVFSFEVACLTYLAILKFVDLIGTHSWRTRERDRKGGHNYAEHNEESHSDDDSWNKEVLRVKQF